MSVYIVVEGECEKKVYSKWVQYANPNLSQAQDFANVTTNNYYIVAGGGVPSYFNVIPNAILDVNDNLVFDKLVISVDSENMTYEEKMVEMNTFLRNYPCRVPVHLIIEHFCLETWALGNRRIIRRNTTNPKLLYYLTFFNVINNDPEDLPPFDEDELNRAQFAERYLHTIINDRFTRLTYTKHNPIQISYQHYYDEILNRHMTTNHINSFSQFVAAFS